MQSLSLSHTHTRGMQRLVMAHWNWLGAQVTSAAKADKHSTEYSITASKQAKAIACECGYRSVGGAVRLTAVFLILAPAAVVLAVAAEDARDAATRTGAFKLARKAHVDVWL